MFQIPFFSKKSHKVRFLKDFALKTHLFEEFNAKLPWNSTPFRKTGMKITSNSFIVSFHIKKGTWPLPTCMKRN